MRQLVGDAGFPLLMRSTATRARERFQGSVDTGVVELIEHQLSRRRLASLPR